MTNKPETLVFAFYQNVLYSFARAESHTYSVFGGPLDIEISGKSLGMQPPHLIAYLSNTIAPLTTSSHSIPDIPLVYGMCYSGCVIKYQFEINKINILELDPEESSDDWPYIGFPQILPYAPLKIEEQKSMTWSEFADTYPNMPEPQPTELVVVIPPSMTLGVSLWGRSGDAEEVTIVFECDLATQTISAYNVCG